MKTRKDTTAKLADVEAKMRRWHTRLIRASNMLQKLERQRRRLELQQQVGVGRPTNPRAVMMEVPVPTRTMAERTAEQRAARADDLDTPDFLKRKEGDAPFKPEPQLVDKLKAQRADKVEADKKKMPLTGRDAEKFLASVRPKKKKVAADLHK
jgi:hypothetical protein